MKRVKSHGTRKLHCKHTLKVCMGMHESRFCCVMTTGFEVAMDNVLCVAVIHSRKELKHELLCIVLGVVPGRDNPVEQLA